MRILFYQWGTFNESVIEKTMRELGHFVRVRKAKDDAEQQPEMLPVLLAKEAGEYHANIFFSVDYFPNIALAAKSAGILYYSWIFHLPQWNLFSFQAQLPSNRIFTFDSEQERELKLYNVNCTNYLSLAADKELLADALLHMHEGEERKYISDVSFVGTLYESTNNSFNRISEDARKTETYNKVVDLIKKKKFTYGKEVLYRGIDEEIIDFLVKETGLNRDNYFFAKQEDIVIQSVLARKITVEERKTMARVMAKNFDFKLYTNSNTSRYPEINNCGPVSFHQQAPLVFNQSKVNINITPRAIRTGIPLRLLEIMACQGFVLTNYQEDLATEFEDGRELVVYHSLEDMVQKTKYYLAHEDKRMEIAKAGYEKVLREHNYAEKLRKILEENYL